VCVCLCVCVCVCARARARMGMPCVRVCVMVSCLPKCGNLANAERTVSLSVNKTSVVY